MLPGDEQKGPSSKSELFDSLRLYLDNSNRLQPIIGLGSIIECVKADAHNKQALYLCEVCICRLSKSDMRNHIMGSLHRYNYIKSWYPHLVSGWEESSDLSKLARPLMDMAKNLEGKEGPGDVQLIKVEDDVYQKIATHSENDAITIISSLRGEPESDPETAPSQSQRIVLLARRPPSEKSFKAAMRSLKTKHQVLSELSRLSGRSSCYFEGYTGTKPLIGLCCVVECKNEDGQTCGFLCHCCRTRTKRRGITDHLTSSSHLFNYLMETHPEKVRFVTAADNDSIELLQSLAEKVEEDEGRGNPKVVTAPESICNRMEKKSYNWCVRMLCRSSISTNNQQQKVAFKGPKVNTSSVQDMSNIHDASSNWAQTMTWRKKNKKKVIDTVFNVSLPFTNGPVLLERTSFSKDRLPLPCTFSPSSDPESQTEQSKLDNGFKLFVVNDTDPASGCRTSQLLQDVYNNDRGACQYVGQEENTVSVHRGVGDYFWNNEHDHYNPSYACKEGYVEQCYKAVAQSKTGTEVQGSSENRQKEMSSDAAWHHYQQLPQYMAPDYANLSVGHHGSSDESVPHVDANRMGTYPYFGYSYPHSASAAPEPRTQFQMQPYAQFTVDYVHSAPYNFMTQPTVYQAGQFGYGSTADPNPNIRPRLNESQPFPHPVSGGNGVGAMYQSNAYVPPSQAYYGAQTNVTVTARCNEFMR